MTQSSDVHLLPFVTEGAERINAARVAHFEGLGLTVAGHTVADFGAWEAGVLTGDLTLSGRFDYGFAYGLLSRLSDPLLGLRKMARVVDRVLFLETQVADAAEPLVVYVDEPDVANQAIDGWGTRPSPSWLIRALQHVGFPYVYQAPSAPDFPDFRWSPRYDNACWRDDHPLRMVLIASRDALEAPLHLVCEPLRASNRPTLCIGSNRSWLEFGASSAVRSDAGATQILANAVQIDHVLDADGHVEAGVLRKWALERTENLVLEAEHPAVEGILESFSHLRTARVSDAWSESTGSNLLRAVQEYRAGGWRVADARSGSGRILVDLTRAPLPPVLKWSRLEYEAEPCNEAVVRQTGDSLSLETPAGEWSYGVILRLRARSVEQVRLSLECTGAPCEVATLTSQTEIFHAATIIPAEGETVVALRTPPSLYGVVIRTGALRGPAVVTVGAVFGVASGRTTGSV